MKNLPKAIAFKQLPSLTSYGDDGDEEGNAFIRDIAEQYLRQFAPVSGTDKTFGLRDRNGKFYTGKEEAKIMEMNITGGHKEYVATPGLWELIVARTLDDKMFFNDY